MRDLNIYLNESIEWTISSTLDTLNTKPGQKSDKNEKIYKLIDRVASIICEHKLKTIEKFKGTSDGNGSYVIFDPNEKLYKHIKDILKREFAREFNIEDEDWYVAIKFKYNNQRICFEMHNQPDGMLVGFYPYDPSLRKVPAAVIKSVCELYDKFISMIEPGSPLNTPNNTINVSGGSKHKFVVYKCSWKYCKQTEMDHLLDREYPILAYVYDANEKFLPDFTPDWLYDIMNSVKKQSGGDYTEHMESVFGMNKKFYELLIKHPDCLKIGTLENERDENNL